MAKSRFDYIHNNKNTISIGIKGTARTTFKKSDIYKAINNIQRKSVELSEALTKNEKFPAELGLSTEPTAVLGDVVDVLDDVVNNRGDYINAPKLRMKIYDLLETEKKPNVFDDKFFGFVRNYYGVGKMPIDMVKDAASKGKLKYTPSDKGKYGDSDPTRLQNWIINELNLTKEEADRLIRPITDISELKKTIQEIELLCS